MGTQRIQIAYDGESVRDGSMDVRELGSALMAIGSLFHSANGVLNADRASVSVTVSSRFRQSSFEIDLGVILTFLEGTQQTLEIVRAARDAKELADLIGFTMSAHAAGVDIPNLIELVKRLKGRVPAIVSTDRQQNTTTINVGNDQYVISADVVNLYQSKQVMDSLGETVKPVTRQGIDTVKFLEGGKLVQEIGDAEAQYFSAGGVPTEAEELIAPHERIVAVQVVKPSFDPKLRWAVSDGDARYGVVMKDENFLAKLQNREISFAKGDTLKVKLLSRTSQLSDGSLHTENTITEVIEHIRPGVQRRLL